MTGVMKNYWPIDYETELDDPGIISIKDLRKMLNKIAKDNVGEHTLLQFDAGYNNISVDVVTEIKL